MSSCSEMFASNLAPEPKRASKELTTERVCTRSETKLTTVNGTSGTGSESNGVVKDQQPGVETAWRKGMRK